MPTITKIDPSKPLENFVSKRGEALFNWAWETWKGFVLEVLQELEKDEISDENFVLICQKMNLVRYLRDYDEYGGFFSFVEESSSGTYYGPASYWLEGLELPLPEVREEICRKMLVKLAECVRGDMLETFIESMVLLAKTSDGRRVNERHILTPNSHSRSIHRLGLERNVSDVLYSHDIKTFGELKDFVKPPLPGGLRISSDKHLPKTKPKFNPEEKLLKLEGMDGESAAAVMEVVEEWDCMMSPATLYV